MHVSLTGHNFGCEEGFFFSLKWKFLFDLLLLNLILLHNGNPNNRDIKTKDKVKVFHSLVIPFFFNPSTMVFIQKSLYLHKWNLFYTVFFSLFFL